jgi:sugar-specific transcriptional regulator TrmB
MPKVDTDRLRRAAKRLEQERADDESAWVEMAADEIDEAREMAREFIQQTDGRAIPNGTLWQLEWCERFKMFLGDA